MLILISTIIIDSSVLKFNDLIPKSYIHHHEKMLLFAINTSLCLILVFLIINYIEKSFKKNPLNKKFSIELLYRISLNSLFVLATLFALLLFQMSVNSYYNISISIFIILISYGTAVAFLVKLILLIISWSRSNLNLIVSLFIASMILIAFNLVMTAIVTDIRLADRSDEIREYIGGSADISAGKNALLNNVYTITSITSFISIWITTTILINYYREKSVSKFTYLVVLTIPLLYFLLNYLYPFILNNLIINYFTVDPVNISIILTGILSLSKPIGGLTFAIAFWKISKNLSYERNIKTHMIICGWGILLIFGTNQPGAQTLAPYPPFGLVTLTVLILGAFMMLLGIYNSALLVGSNNKLRNTIRRQALEAKLLGIMGRAQMQEEIEKTVRKITRIKGELEKDSELPIEFDEEGLKDYLTSLVAEIKKEKHEKTSNN